MPMLREMLLPAACLAFLIAACQSQNNNSFGQPLR